MGMPDSTPTPRTRLAPSPTGALHLGNARTFLINWALARRAGWKITLRIEDLDGPRVKPDAAAGILRTLEWLGIDWDEGPIIQSDDLLPYREAMRHLARHADAFVSNLTRAEIEAAASAPQEGTGEVPFPASLRPPLVPLDFDTLDAAESNWRFAVPTPAATDSCASAADRASVVRFTDEFAGPQSIDVTQSIGDFIIWTKRRQPAYQLAVVVDDHRQGITHIVRGDDLLPSAARQRLLYRALGYTPVPHYYHLPLVIGTDGKRLAKRHGDTRIDTYRALGVPPEAIIGLIAHWSPVPPHSRPPSSSHSATDTPPRLMSGQEFLHAFSLSNIPPHPIVFTPEHDTWLRSFAR